MAVKPEDMPCTVCEATPTVAQNRAPVDGYHGRVCNVHASEAADAGHVVCYDDHRGIVNWTTWASHGRRA